MAYIYDSFVIGPSDNCNGFTVKEQFLAELRSCSPKHFVEMGVAENDTMWLSMTREYLVLVWLSDTYAISEKYYSRSLHQRRECIQVLAENEKVVKSL